MEPTTMTPWMALDPDMSGVCRMLGTLEITSMPTNADSTKIVASSSSPFVTTPPQIRLRPPAAPRSSATSSLPGWPSRRRQQPATISSSHLGSTEPSGPSRSSRLRTLRAYRTLACMGMADGRVADPHHRRARHVDHLAGAGGLAVATPIGGHVHHHGARGHRPHHVGRHQHRGAAPWYRRRRDHDVGGRHLGGQRLALAGQLVVAQLAGVATGPLGGHPEVDERGAEALGLLLGGRPDVIGPNDRSQATAGGDGLEAGDAHAEYQHLGRRDGSRSRHEHGEELGQVLGGDQARPVAGDRRLRRQRIHALGSADAGQEVEAEDARALLGEGPQRVDRIGEREEAQHQEAVGQRRHVIGGRCVDPHGRRGTGIERRRVGDRGSGGEVRLVGEGRPETGAGLDGDLPALGDQALGYIGHHGHPALTRARLRRDDHLHEEFV